MMEGLAAPEDAAERNDGHDRCDLSEGAPHGIKPAGKKGGAGA
jgi:hypothetical protein